MTGGGCVGKGKKTQFTPVDYHVVYLNFHFSPQEQDLRATRGTQLIFLSLNRFPFASRTSSSLCFCPHQVLVTAPSLPTWVTDFIFFP